MATQQAIPINIGIAEADRKTIVQGLERLLADSFTLYLKTLYFHWNVTGPMFQPLHAVFETQYTELIMANDRIAERIRSLGAPAPGTFQQFSRLTSIKEDSSVPDAETMIKLLVEGHETVIRTAREALPAARNADDEVTLGLLVERLDTHEKTAWMLRSFLKP